MVLEGEGSLFALLDSAFGDSPLQRLFDLRANPDSEFQVDATIFRDQFGSITITVIAPTHNEASQGQTETQPNQDDSEQGTTDEQGAYPVEVQPAAQAPAEPEGDAAAALLAATGLFAVQLPRKRTRHGRDLDNLITDR